MKNNKARKETAISDSFLKAAISDINSLLKSSLKTRNTAILCTIVSRL